MSRIHLLLSRFRTTVDYRRKPPKNQQELTCFNVFGKIILEAGTFFYEGVHEQLHQPYHNEKTEILHLYLFLENDRLTKYFYQIQKKVHDLFLSSFYVRKIFFYYSEVELRPYSINHYLCHGPGPSPHLRFLFQSSCMKFPLERRTRRLK